MVDRLGDARCPQASTGRPGKGLVWGHPLALGQSDRQPLRLTAASSVARSSNWPRTRASIPPSSFFDSASSTATSSRSSSTTGPRRTWSASSPPRRPRSAPTGMRCRSTFPRATDLTPASSAASHACSAATHETRDDLAAGCHPQDDVGARRATRVARPRSPCGGLRRRSGRIRDRARQRPGDLPRPVSTTQRNPVRRCGRLSRDRRRVQTAARPGEVLPTWMSSPELHRWLYPRRAERPQYARHHASTSH